MQKARISRNDGVLEIKRGDRWIPQRCYRGGARCGNGCPALVEHDGSDVPRGIYLFCLHEGVRYDISED